MTIKYSKIDGSIYELKDPLHLKRVRSLPCCVDGCNNNSIAHHLFSRKLGTKDHKSINICVVHHNLGGITVSIHQMGREPFELQYGIDTEELADRLYRETERLRA